MSSCSQRQISQNQNCLHGEMLLEGSEKSSIYLFRLFSMHFMTLLDSASTERWHRHSVAHGAFWSGTAFLFKIDDPLTLLMLVFPSDSPISALHFQSICERVTPRLSHANSAVVLSAVKVLMKFLELLPKDSDYYNTLLKKLSPPLVTLLSGEPEVQYVALRNINLIVQKRCVWSPTAGALRGTSSVDLTV